MSEVWPEQDDYLEVRKARLVAEYKPRRVNARDVSDFLRDAIGAWDQKFEDTQGWERRPELQLDDGKELARYLRDCLVEAEIAEIWTSTDE